MSNEALSAVSKANIRPSGRKFVAMALADYADENWSCFPSVQMLAIYTSQGEKTVRDHLDALENDGVITRERARREDGTLGRYRFFIHRRNLPVANFARGEKRQKPPANFATHNPHIEPPVSSSLRSEDAHPTAPAKRTPREELLSVLDAEHADAVLEHRKQIRKPMTARAAKLLSVEFSKTGDPNAAADHMIVSGWQGFKAEWMQRQHSPPPMSEHQRRHQAAMQACDRFLGRQSDEPDDFTGPTYDLEPADYGTRRASGPGDRSRRG